jgi:hypothetical protein
MAEPAERVVDVDDVVGEGDPIPEVYRRRRHGRSYFTPPAAWNGPREAARERFRRANGRW